MRCIPGLAAILLVTVAMAQRPLASRPPVSRPASPAGLPGRVTFVEDIQYAEGFANEPRRNRLDLYVPASGGGDQDGRSVLPPMVMFVHGGAWTGGNKEFGAGLALALVQRGIACACINTQLFPFARPDAMVADCGRALAWLHAHGPEHGYDGDRLFLMGHSAGGHLVSWLLLDDARRAATGVPATALRGGIALSGVHELRARHPALDKVFGTDPTKRREASPFVHASAGDPPMMLVWGEHDMPGLSLCARMLRDRLRDLGTSVVAEELAGRGHVDYVVQLGAPGDRVLDRLVAFVQQPPAVVAPVAPTAPTAPPTALSRSVVQLAGLPAIDVVAPGSGARATLLWVVGAAAERAPAERLATSLAPYGVAVGMLAAPGVGTTQVAALWRALRGQTGALALPAPGVLGGFGASAAIVAAAPLGRADGLRARVFVAADPGPGPGPGNGPGNGLGGAAMAERLGGAGRHAPSVLFAQGAGDAERQRDEVVLAGTLLAQRLVDVHVIEVPGLTSATAMQQLGAPDDVLLPVLRAFVLP